MGADLGSHLCTDAAAVCIRRKQTTAVLQLGNKVLQLSEWLGRAEFQDLMDAIEVPMPHRLGAEKLDQIRTTSLATSLGPRPQTKS